MQKFLSKINDPKIVTDLKPKVFVAMSGGVDSSVAALLLKARGYEVVGCHIVSWDGCGAQDDRRDALRVCAKLGIPFYTFDFRREYRERVFDYMVREYARGRTPNPDVMCNKHIKFGVFLEHALRMGADYIATGHYAKKIKNQKSKIKIYEARDRNKDQSYFLWTLTREKLARCLFPIGEYVKSEVRETARRAGLPTADKKDSQGLCFVGRVDFGDFLRTLLPQTPGTVVRPSGEVIGSHDGVHFYTIGQRRGLGLGGFPSPLYVAEKQPETNTLVVAEENPDSSLYRRACPVREVNWVSGSAPELPFSCQARLRYRQPLQAVRLFSVKDAIRLVFDIPQRAITPGQSAVFYQQGELLGGGVIDLSLAQNIPYRETRGEGSI